MLAAIEGIEGARLIVKPHPAEPEDAYDQDIAASTLGERVRVIADRSLTDILPAADLLVTVESLSATEALVAGVPVVVLRHPSNLRDVVASGAALGVPDGADPRPAIESLLRDEASRAAWRRSRDAFLNDVARGVDGQALEPASRPGVHDGGSRESADARSVTSSRLRGLRSHAKGEADALAHRILRFRNSVIVVNLRLVAHHEKAPAFEIGVERAAWRLLSRGWSSFGWSRERAARSAVQVPIRGDDRCGARRCPGRSGRG